MASAMDPAVRADLPTMPASLPQAPSRRSCLALRGVTSRRACLSQALGLTAIGPFVLYISLHAVRSCGFSLMAYQVQRSTW